MCVLAAAEALPANVQRTGAVGCAARDVLAVAAIASQAHAILVCRDAAPVPRFHCSHFHCEEHHTPHQQSNAGVIASRYSTTVLSKNARSITTSVALHRCLRQLTRRSLQNEHPGCPCQASTALPKGPPTSYVLPRCSCASMRPDAWLRLRCSSVPALLHAHSTYMKECAAFNERLLFPAEKVLRSSAPTRHMQLVAAEPIAIRNVA